MNDDLISRQAAIDAIKNQTCLTYEEIFNRCLVSIKDENGWLGGIKGAIEALIDLPSAQPEIIRCKECKHGKYDIFDRGMWCELHPSLDVTEDDFCSFAVMRKGGKNEI